MTHINDVTFAALLEAISAARRTTPSLTDAELAARIGPRIGAPEVNYCHVRRARCHIGWAKGTERGRKFTDNRQRLVEAGAIVARIQADLRLLAGALKFDPEGRRRRREQHVPTASCMELFLGRVAGAVASAEFPRVFGATMMARFLRANGVYTKKFIEYLVAREYVSRHQSGKVRGERPIFTYVWNRPAERSLAVVEGAQA